MFDIHQSIYDPDSGEIDFDAFHVYVHDLMVAFADSLEGQGVIERQGNVGHAYSFMDFGVNHLSLLPHKMAPRDVEEIVFRIIPRKLSTEPDYADDIIDELRAFWTFLQRVYNLPNAPKILAMLNDGAAGRLKRELGNPRNFGMAKSIMMTGRELGFDMTTEAGLAAFMAYFNGRLGDARPSTSPPVFAPVLVAEDDYVNDFDDGFEEPEPLVPGATPKERAEMRKKKRKAERQARKRARDRR